MEEREKLFTVGVENIRAEEKKEENGYNPLKEKE